MKKNITIILPFYNTENYLKASITSILTSNYKKFELNLINDGSTDNSFYIASEFVKQDPRIRIIDLPHGGIVKALNTGIHEASTDIIVRMDANDICHPDRFKLQYEYLSTHPSCALVSCLVEPFSEHLTDGINNYMDWVNNSLTHEDILRDLYVESPIPHPSVMFRREVVIKLGGYRDYDGPEDYDLWLRMADSGCRFSKLPEILLQWRIDDESLSRKNNRYRKKAFWVRKTEYLCNQLKSGKIACDRKIHICGTGASAKFMCRYFLNNGVPVTAFVDIDERKIGKMCQSLPVLPLNSIRRDTKYFYVCTVKNWVGRDQLKSHFESLEMQDMIDYLFV